MKTNKGGKGFSLADEYHCSEIGWQSCLSRYRTSKQLVPRVGILIYHWVPSGRGLRSRNWSEIVNFDSLDMKGQKSALYLTPRSQCGRLNVYFVVIHTVALRIQSTVWTDKLSTLKKVQPRAKIVSDRNVKRLVFVLLEIYLYTALFSDRPYLVKSRVMPSLNLDRPHGIESNVIETVAPLLQREE